MENEKPIASGTVSFTATAEYIKPKVYCKNCKYYSNFKLYDCKYILGIIDHPISKKTRYVHSDIENKDNNCPFFKKKWWKIFN